MQGGIDKITEGLFSFWKKFNIGGIYSPDRRAASKRILELIPLSATIGLSGSKTLDELGVIAKLEERGNKVFNQFKPGLTRQESMLIRKQGAGADYFLTSANAVSESGELVFLSAYGHRIAGIANAGHVIVVCGVNKLASDLPAALKRAREYVTPLNCQRLNWKSACLQDQVCRRKICRAPGYKRMCCQLLVIEAEIVPDRLKVIVVNETLGF